MGVSRYVVIDQEYITVAVSPAVQQALTEWVSAHEADLAERLAVHGLKPGDIVLPEFRRVIRPEEVAR